MTSNVPDPPLVPPDIPAGEGDPVPVFLVNATRTSGGAGPGVVRVPPAEAARLVSQKLAVHGDKPPRGWNLMV